MVYRGLLHSRELRDLMKEKRGSSRRRSSGRKSPRQRKLSAHRSMGSCTVAIKRLKGMYTSQNYLSSHFLADVLCLYPSLCLPSLVLHTFLFFPSPPSPPAPNSPPPPPPSPHSSYDTTENIDGPDKANFLKEIEMMKTVSGTNHEHQKFVVNMLGCVTLQEPMMLVLEYATHGDLLSYLRESRDEVCVWFSAVQLDPLISTSKSEITSQ